MKILITGAAGFIGSQLAYRLWKEGESVILLDNFSYGKEDNLIFPDKDFRSEILKLDIRDGEKIEEIIRGNKIETVFHIAGIAPLPDCQNSPGEAIGVNVVGTVNILEAARKFGIKKIVFASTTAIYENDKAFPSVESKFELPSLIYPNTKYCAERFCESYCLTYGLNVTALRFANVYGPHIDFLRKQPPFVGYMIRELYYGRTPTFYSNGKQSRDYIYVDDLIDLAIFAARGKFEGFETLNVSSNKAYSVSEMFGIASKIMGKNITPNFEDPVKYWSKYPELYAGHFPIKQEILNSEVNKKTLCDNSLARSRYGWEPKVGMEEGLRRLVEYIKRTIEEK
jgi:UDP-glucose 4-epimerase